MEYNFSKVSIAAQEGSIYRRRERQFCKEESSTWTVSTWGGERLTEGDTLGLSRAQVIDIVKLLFTVAVWDKNKHGVVARVQRRCR
ncbi:hypothetical protein SKAU_G00408620 [Synaphobranchus kaupii]|uniref:Uncharacterized protein n=1 Tax=Synaphobranchus kaupii TaxID=118154 RepID=A0A9Q1EAF0_SYNKA|nr:hypothetical protein SKAU_G00408620 [Synaphobranchus kaupii]